MSKEVAAIILAAGKGIRLAPLTQHLPKSLIEINGEAILLRSLAALDKVGIRKCVVVVGYKEEMIRDKISKNYKGTMSIIYISNYDFEVTNNIYSLWLAREYLENFDVLLLEGDVIFDNEILSLLDFSSKHSYWMVDVFKNNMDGALLVTDSYNKIVDIKIIKEPLELYENNFYKSIGILMIKKEFGRKLSLWLSLDSNIGNRAIYYDLVIAKHLNKADLFIKYIGNLKWWEIDNEKDLALAIALFGK